MSNGLQDFIGSGARSNRVDFSNGIGRLSGQYPRAFIFGDRLIEIEEAGHDLRQQHLQGEDRNLALLSGPKA